MAARILPAGSDPIRPGDTRGIALSIDGESIAGLAGQTIAGVVLASGQLAWRHTSSEGKPRGLFCGIGICFDCIVTVNGERDVRACQRRASDGDVILTQHDPLPEVHA